MSLRKSGKASYASLVAQVVHDSPEPLPFKEILSRVETVKAIDTTSPESTIRHALTQNRLIANTGEGRYGWYPRLITGSFVRAYLSRSDLNRLVPRIILEDEMRELLWPSFFANQNMSDRSPVVIVLPDGSSAESSLEFFGNGVWGAVEAIGNPGHPEHEDMSNWIGGSFDPEHINIEQINYRLRRSTRD
jgi:hypothetical protein